MEKRKFSQADMQDLLSKLATIYESLENDFGEEIWQDVAISCTFNLKKEDENNHGLSSMGSLGALSDLAATIVLQIACGISMDNPSQPPRKCVEQAVDLVEKDMQRMKSAIDKKGVGDFPDEKSFDQFLANLS